MTGSSKDWEESYQEDMIPWDTGFPDPHLTGAILRLPRKPGSLLEVGCGYGHSVRWASSMGIRAHGVDLSPTAIERANSLASEAELPCRFSVVNLLETGAPEGPYQFAYDRGCFHTLDLKSERELFVKNLADSLEEGGLWLSLIGSADDSPRDSGPPMRSVADFAEALESRFEILSLEADYFYVHREQPPRGWVLLSRLRSQ